MKIKLAIFCGCYGKHPFGGPAIRMRNIAEMLSEHNIDFNIFHNHDCHEDYYRPEAIKISRNINKVDLNKFNVFWVEQDFRYVTLLNNKGIEPIIGTNIIPNSCPQHAIPYMDDLARSKQRIKLINETKRIKTLRGKFWLAQSDFQTKEFRKMGLDDTISIYQASNPVNIKQFKSSYVDKSKIIIGWTGKNVWQKKPEFLKEIASELENTIFYYLSERMNEITYFPDNVKQITGNTNIQMPEILNELSIFMSTSVTELQPLGVLEAMACGLPVMAFRTSSLPELVKHNENGILIDLANREHYVVEIKRLLKNPDKIKKLGKNARKFIVNNFSYKALFPKYKKFLEKYVRINS